VAAPDVVRVLDSVRPPNSVSTTSAAVAVAALQQVDAMRERVRTLVAERSTLATALRAQGREVVEGVANFVLARATTDEVRRAVSHGLVLRTFPPTHGLAEWVRITVRSPEENRRLLAALGPQAAR
jgi:histidinol-phosphate aminotransferase